MAGFRWGATGGSTGPLPVWPLAFALLLVPTGLGSTPAGATTDHVAFGKTSVLPSPPNLTVTPTTAWVEDGNSTPLSAIWGPVGPACTIRPSWFQWFVNSSEAGGLLSSQNGSATNFSGATRQTEATEVGVRSAATLACGNTTQGVFRTAYATVTTVAPLVVGDVAATPLLLPGTGTANLSALVEGGVLPYWVEVEWGDGNVSVLPVTIPGWVSLNHQYRSGTFLPMVTVTDSSGLEVSVSAPERIEATSGGAFAISASLPVAEVGLPVRFSSLANPAGADDRVGMVACGNRAFGPASASVNVTCVPPEAGALSVLLGEVGSNASSVLLAEPVVPALALSVVPLAVDGETDLPSSFEVRISGGAPPFTLAGSFEGVPLPTESGIPGDGSLLLEATPGAAGLASLTLRVTDADGVEVTGATASILVAPPLLVSLSTSTVPQGAIAQVALVASLAGGVGPVGWVISTRPGPVLADPPTGGARVDSSFEWTGSFGSEGAASIWVTVVDAAGAQVRSSVSAVLLPPLSGQFDVAPVDSSDGPSLNLSLELAGGAPPFSIWVNATGTASWNATDPSDGAFVAEVPLARAGPLSVSLVTVDALGGRLVGRTSVVVAEPPPAEPTPTPPPGDPSLWGGGVAVALLAGGAGYYVYRGRRSARPPAPAPDPVQVLQGILAPADGAERVTVELLAEEAGIPLDTVRSTLTGLIASGRVRSEVSSEGMEVLAWSTSSRP